MPEKGYEYVIYVDDKEVWRGKEPRGKYEEMEKAYPGRKISIAWEPGEMALIAHVQACMPDGASSRPAPKVAWESFYEDGPGRQEI